MKYLILFVSIFIFLLSCSNKTEKAIIDHINDYSFKNNLTVDVINLEVLDEEIKNISYLDTIKLMRLDYQFDSIGNELELMRSKISESENEIEGSMVFGLNNPLFKFKYNQHQELLRKYSKLLNEMRLNSHIDSVIRSKINPNNEMSIIKVKVFQKLIFKNNNTNSHNVMDTVTYYLDQKGRVIHI